MKTANRHCELQASEPLILVAPNMLSIPQEFSTELSEVTMADDVQKDWRELCLAVTNETDSAKLTCLVQELIEALDRGEQSWQHPIPPSDPIAASRETA